MVGAVGQRRVHVAQLRETPRSTPTPKPLVEPKLDPRAHATVGQLAHSGDAAKASAADRAALEGALAALHKVAAQLEQIDLAANKPARVRLASRLKQTVQTLERLGVKDPVAQATLESCLARIEGAGGGIDLAGLAAKLRALLPGRKVKAAAPVEKTRVERLGQHLDEAVSAYKAGDYAKVRHMLTDQDVAASLGLHIKMSACLFQCDPKELSREDIDSLVLQIRMSSMSYDSGKIELVDAGFIQFGPDGPKGGGGIESHPELAEKVLPIMLEEWMHQLQRLQGKPVSKLTEAFIEDRRANWDHLHEMDIYAAFREWGFPVERLGTVDAYPERGVFERWYQDQRDRGKLS